MSISQRTKFIVTEVRQHISHDVHTIEDFVMRHFGDVPVPVNVKIVCETLSEILEKKEEPAPAPAADVPEAVGLNATEPTPEDGKAAEPAAQ